MCKAVRNVTPDAALTEISLILRLFLFSFFFLCLMLIVEAQWKKKSNLKREERCLHKFLVSSARLSNVDACYSTVAYNICHNNVPVNIFTKIKACFLCSFAWKNNFWHGCGFILCHIFLFFRQNVFYWNNFFSSLSSFLNFLINIVISQMCFIV